MGFLIHFFVKNNINSKRFLWMAVLAFLPVAVSFLMLLFKPFLENQDVEIADMFARFSFTLYLHLLLPLLTVFLGTAIIADEVEERTLPYLLTRPIPRWKLVLSKTCASILISSILLVTSIFLTYTLLKLSGGWESWSSELPELFQCMGVLIFGVCVYTPFFGLLSGFLKRPVLVGLLFTFGWENMAAFFPGNIKLITIVYYLHRLYPHSAAAKNDSIQSLIIQNLTPAKELSTTLSFFILLILFVFFISSLAFVLSMKEFRLSQE